MTDCGHDHVITGESFADGTLIPVAWIEVVVEILCEKGKLRPRAPQFDAPDEGGEQ